MTESHQRHSVMNERCVYISFIKTTSQIFLFCCYIKRLSPTYHLKNLKTTNVIFLEIPIYQITRTYSIHLQVSHTHISKLLLEVSSIVGGDVSVNRKSSVKYNTNGKVSKHIA